MGRPQRALSTPSRRHSALAHSDAADHACCSTPPPCIARQHAEIVASDFVSAAISGAVTAERSDGTTAPAEGHCSSVSYLAHVTQSGAPSCINVECPSENA